MNIKAPKNGYVFIYVSNRSDQDVYFDNLLAGITAGNIIEENHFYAFGLRIATISSKKLGDIPEGSLKNNYLMQGAFAEIDDDIGWNDFELRNYDPQIGRWVQQDPYQQFASSYIGMGNDPVNSIDPSGGGIFDGLSAIGNAGVRTLLGAIIGETIGLLSGDDSWKGAAIGAGIGLGSSFSFSITTKVVQIANTTAALINTSIAVKNVGNLIDGQNSTTLSKEVDYGTNSGASNAFQGLRSFNESEILNLINNGISGRSDPDRTTPLSCLKAFVSNLKALYGGSGPTNYPTNDNMSAALSQLEDLGLARNKTIIESRVDGKVLSSRSHNGSKYYDGDHFTGVIKSGVLEFATEWTGYESIGVFAVGIAAQYHSTLLVVVKNPKFTIKDPNTGKSFKGSQTDPFYVLVEDSYGALLGSADDISARINPFITGARAYYRGTKTVGGKSFPSYKKNINLGNWIYMLYHAL